MCIEIAEKTTPLEILASQVKFIKTQERDEIPVKALAVRCPCLKKVRWIDAYRCLYCGIFHCRECAEKHFGKTIEEYRTEQSA